VVRDIAGLKASVRFLYGTYSYAIIVPISKKLGFKFVYLVIIVTKRNYIAGMYADREEVVQSNHAGGKSRPETRSVAGKIFQGWENISHCQ
jgi:hypothetical protein